MNSKNEQSNFYICEISSIEPLKGTVRTDIIGSIYISLNSINNEITFQIKDTGCGIDNETGKHIFDKFYQGDTSHSKEGNGLGLALVKKVVDILGGEINVSSEKNIGTTFIVKLKGEIYGK